MNALAEKFGEFLSTDPAERAECMSWLFWQMGSAPYLGGGFGHFYAYAPEKFEYPIDRFSMEVKRQLDVPTACMAKYWVTELQGEVVDKCLQFHGGAGFINDYPIARMFRDSRITRIFGGSNEVMKMVIARSM